MAIQNVNKYIIRNFVGHEDRAWAEEVAAEVDDANVDSLVESFTAERGGVKETFHKIKLVAGADVDAIITDDAGKTALGL